MGVNNSGPKMDKFFNELDIVGYNYRIDTYESDQKRAPKRVSYGSESFSRYAFEYWQKVEDLPYIVGDFVWTGWDYLGEASIGWTGYAPKWD
jgi:beta-galactosidase